MAQEIATSTPPLWVSQYEGATPTFNVKESQKEPGSAHVSGPCVTAPTPGGVGPVQEVVGDAGATVPDAGADASVGTRPTRPMIRTVSGMTPTPRDRNLRMASTRAPLHTGRPDRGRGPSPNLPSRYPGTEEPNI